MTNNQIDLAGIFQLVADTFLQALSRQSGQ